MEGRERGWLRGRENERRREKAGCGRLSLQSLRVVAEDENKCTDYSSLVEKKGRYGTLLRRESCGHFLKGRAPWPLSQGESAVTLAWTGFYCFSRVLRQRRIYYLLHRMLLSTF